MKKMLDILFFIVGVVIGLLLIDEVTEAINDPVNDMKRQAIERGHALYCPHDGEFAWVGECEQKGEE